MNLYINFASYLGVALLLVAGIVLFIISTPKLKEFSLIVKRMSLLHCRSVVRLSALPLFLAQQLNIRIST